MTHRNPKIGAPHLPKYESKDGVDIETTGIHIKALQLQPFKQNNKISTTLTYATLIEKQKEWSLTCILGQAMTRHPALARSTSSS